MSPELLEFLLNLLQYNIGAFFAFLMFLLLKQELHELRKEIRRINENIVDILKKLVDLE